MAYDPNEPRDQQGEWTSEGGGGGWQKARVSIRPKVFRGKEGFGISGKDTRGRSVSIFTETRSSAEHIKAKLHMGLNIDSPDFQPHDSKLFSLAIKKRVSARARIKAQTTPEMRALQKSYVSRVIAAHAHDAKPINGAVGKPVRHG